MISPVPSVTRSTAGAASRTAMTWSTELSSGCRVPVPRRNGHHLGIVALLTVRSHTGHSQLTGCDRSVTPERSDLLDEIRHGVDDAGRAVGVPLDVRPGA